MSSKEYTHHEEEEREPTPQQLNAQLNKLFDHLPKVVAGGEEEWDQLSEEEMFDWLETPKGQTWGDKLLEEAKRRETSEYKQRLTKKVSMLICKASITPTFREVIINTFSAGYDTGVSLETEQKEVENRFSFLDRERPESGGIFDPKRSAILESLAFIQVRESQISLAVEDIKGKKEESGKQLSKKQQNKIIFSWLEPLEKWRKQLVEYHWFGSKPDPT